MQENRLIIPKIFSYERLLFRCNPDFNVKCKKGEACQNKCFNTINEAAADITFIGPPRLIDIKKKWKPKKTHYMKLEGVH